MAFVVGQVCLAARWQFVEGGQKKPDGNFDLRGKVPFKKEKDL